MNKEVILLGDFNVNWDNKSDRKKLKEITDYFGFTQIIDDPTRITSRSKTRIDLVFSNKPERIVKSHNFLTGLSDHNAIFISRKLTKKRFNLKSHNTKQNFIPRNQEQDLFTALNNLDWSEMTLCNDLDKCCDLLYSTVKDVCTHFFKKGKVEKASLFLALD
ncbi:endonuclease/exonuclease/phosphatase family protein [Cetobacterium sp.]|uniref:endonuclease/exonuclease/phosphatase family protein n=1 Tax=Cetobacterium sp. TaxID=2071632 RepID=UPI003EE6A5B3